MDREQLTSNMSIVKIDNALEEILKEERIIRLRPIVDKEKILKDDEEHKLVKITKGLSLEEFNEKNVLFIYHDVILKDTENGTIYHRLKYSTQENIDSRYYNFANDVRNFVISKFLPDFKKHKVKWKNISVFHINYIDETSSEIQLLDIPNELIASRLSIKEITSRIYKERYNGMVGGRVRESIKSEKKPTEIKYHEEIEKDYLMKKIFDIAIDRQ